MKNINSYCSNMGWLFEDLQGFFQKAGVHTTEMPVEDADGWLCIRTGEAFKTPDITKTVVQVHDLYEYNIAYLQEAALVVFTHPIQLWMWKKRGFTGRYIVLPIGARRGIVLAKTLPRRPTIGFFCGETPAMEKQSHLFKEVVLRLRERMDVDVLMIGRNLEHISDIGTWIDRAAGVDDYQHIDVLFTASISPAVPLSVYEACSVGIPIVSTPRWFPHARWPNVYFGEDADTLQDCLLDVLSHRDAYFEQRANNQYAPFYLEDWVSAQMEHLRALPAYAPPATRRQQNFVGQALTFGRDAAGMDADVFTVYGISIRENDGRWTDGKKTRFFFPGLAGINGDLKFSVSCGAFLSSQNTCQHVDISVNGHVLGAWDIVEAGRQVYELLIPENVIKGKNGPMVIDFALPDAVSPARVGGNPLDTRVLALWLGWMRLDVAA